MVHPDPARLSLAIDAWLAAPLPDGYWPTLANLTINEAIPAYRRGGMTFAETERAFPALAAWLRLLARLKAADCLSHHEAREAFRAVLANLHST